MAGNNYKVIPRTVAISLGLASYFTGRACVNGHTSPRSVKKWECYGCKVERENRRIAKQPAHHKARMQASRDKRKEKDKVAYRRSYNANPERWRARAEKWKAKDPDRVRELARARMARWRERNPELYCAEARTSRFKRKARKLNNGGAHTVQDVQEISAAQAGRCAYCREKLKRPYHVDHIIALSNGGHNGRRNLQILCAPCNLSKGAKDPIDFTRSLGLLL